MNTSDVIALLKTVSGITAIVGDKIHNARVPTKDAITHEVDAPFVWTQFRNAIDWGCQNGPQGDEPLGKVFDVETVAESADVAEDMRNAVYSLDGFYGVIGTAEGRVTVLDQSDDYVARNAAGDAGLFVGSLLIQVIGE